jgi:hypothetical protein
LKSFIFLIVKSTELITFYEVMTKEGKNIVLVGRADNEFLD